MIKKSSNPYYHIAYWLFVILVLTLVFGLSWRNNLAAFFFISMLLPVVLGTSYFFNYVLVPKYYLKKQIVKFVLYSIYTIIISLYLEMVVLMFSFIYIGNFSFYNLDPNASDTILLAVILYLLVFVGSFLLMIRQIRENQQLILQLQSENNKMKKLFLEIMSNRKIVKIPYNEIVYIESLSDYIRVNTVNEQIISKEKISNLASRLPDIFLRIHRSFIINKEKIKSISYNEVTVDDVILNIGRSYRKEVKETLNNK
ncbi:MAG: LytTR family transcriptional regulator [Bacteroidales bacterium]|nr:LytTR family transcriptional regulator [Bacteroidales bacterium]MBN2817705.1 LytTR family transcriptional regulator [Bacteroidales bacterium]